MSGAIFLLVGGPCGLSAEEGGGKDLVSTVTDSNFTSEVLKSNEPVLVDFWATWCGPCRMYGPVVDQVAKEYKGRLKVAKVEVDDNPSLFRSLRVQYIPASFLFRNGKLVRRWMGVVSEADLKSGIDQALKPQEASQ